MSSKKVNNSKPSATVANPNILPVEMLKLAKYTDVTLICSASKIRAHRIVLAVRSAYFQEYFKRHGKATEIVLDVDFDDLKCIILYMYQGVIVIPSDRKTSFLEIAKEFKVSIDEKKMFAVKTRMENFGGNEYNESNFQQIDAEVDDEDCSSTHDIVHANFIKAEILPSSVEEPRKPKLVEKENQPKNACADNQRKPSVVYIKQNEFLKLLGCSKP